MVVLPTPPFWLAIAIIRARPEGLPASGSTSEAGSRTCTADAPSPLPRSGAPITSLLSGRPAAPTGQPGAHCEEVGKSHSSAGLHDNEGSGVGEERRSTNIGSGTGGKESIQLILPE